MFYFSGNMDCVKWLVLNDVDPSIPDNMGKIAEDIALENGHMEVYNFLKGIHVNR